jgi:hypothetical protein
VIAAITAAIVVLMAFRTASDAELLAAIVAIAAFNSSCDRPSPLRPRDLWSDPTVSRSAMSAPVWRSVVDRFPERFGVPDVPRHLPPLRRRPRQCPRAYEAWLHRATATMLLAR